MKNLMFCFLALLPLLFGCANLGQILGETNEDYHFRKVRWGFSRERVELAEAGNTIFERKDNAIVYKVKLNGVYCRLVYTFKDNRLRTAGYMTITSIPNADNLIKEAVDKHGMPDSQSGGMIWKNPINVIYADIYPTFTKKTSTAYKYSGSGLLRDIVRNELPKQKPGEIIYWDGTYTHVDPAFLAQLEEMELPLSDLSFYEKRLMGIILRRGGTIIPGIGTIPN